MKKAKDHTREKPLELVENSGVSSKTLSALSRNFDEEETEIHWADRQAIWAWLFNAAISILIALLLLAVAIYLQQHLGTVSFKTHNYDNKPEHTVRLNFTTYLWILPLVIGMLFLIRPVNSYIRWRLFIRLMTNTKLRVNLEPPSWAFWLWNDLESDPQPLGNILRVEIKGTILGRLLGYGTLRPVTLMQEDDNDQQQHSNWQFVRNYRKVAAEISSRSSAIRAEAKEAAQDMNESLARIAENTGETLAEIREIKRWSMKVGPADEQQR